MKHLRIAALPLLALTACVQTLSPEETAQAAEQVAAAVTARVYPGLFTGPVANCVRSTATAQERATLASYRDNVGGPAQILVLDIIDRPATDACLRSNGITLS